ncbi:MAG: glycosyltransferase family 2 protein [Clostridia bacterium]|nr:glycosyltransferase family 2 protein [Clostridia bacterium]
MILKTLVIVPAHNEQDNITSTIQDLRQHAPDMDILVINDCSTDRTKAILEELKVNFLDLPVNLGIGGGVQAGYLYAQHHGYDIAVQFDGDGQHDAAYLDALTRPVREGRADIAIGSRFVKKEGFQSSGARRMGIHFLSGLIHLLCHVKVHDVTSGMRAINRRFIEEYAVHYAQDYPEPEAILYAGIRGATIVEVPVMMRERQNGKSSIDALHSVYYMIKVSLALLFGKLTIR